MTGAAIPEGADMVFMVEDSSVLTSGKVRVYRVIYKRQYISQGRGYQVG